jgi:hypothetical protein
MKVPELVYWLLVFLRKIRKNDFGTKTLYPVAGVAVRFIR